MYLQLRAVLNIGCSIKSRENLSRGQEKKDYEFIQIANQAMINRFSILNQRRKKLTGWLNTLPKKKNPCAGIIMTNFMQTRLL
jgi:hypothetical protein